MKAFNRSLSLGTEGKEKKGDRERGDNLDERVPMGVGVRWNLCVRVHVGVHVGVFV